MKKFTLLFLLIPILFFGCDGEFIIPFSEYTFDSYDGELNPTMLVKNAEFSNRQDFVAIVFKDYIYVMGGYDSSARGDEDSYKEDVYRSKDGITWEQVTDDAPWKGRRGMAAAVLDENLYISGGFRVDQETGERGYVNDVWKTSDGITWDQVTDSALWTARAYHGMLSGGDYLYIFGGFNGYNTQYFADMYKSTNGINWTKVTADMGLGARASFAYCKDDEAFYLQGGSFKDAKQSSSGRIDYSVTNWEKLWKFDLTNENWSKVGGTPNDAYTRSNHSLIYYNDKLWMFSGKSNSSYTFSEKTRTCSTLYYSNENSSWKIDSNGAIVEPRYGYQTVLFNDKIYLIGGYSSSGPQNDVWTIETTSEEE